MSTLGRWIVVLMMLSGIALIGTVTATLATWLIDEIRIEEPAAGHDSGSGS